jgi:hypothetical protein
MNHFENDAKKPEAIAAFSDYLDGLAPGQVRDTGRLETLLALCWEDLTGSSDGGMEGNKLFGRMESVEWWPPLLTLKIERHGGVFLGSSRTELQHWAIDISKKIASLGVAAIVNTGPRNSDWMWRLSRTMSQGRF